MPDKSISVIDKVEESPDFLLDLRDKWSSALDIISDWVVLVDLNSKIIQSNKVGEEFLGKPFEEIIGKKCCKLLHNSNKHLQECPFLKMLKSHQRETKDMKIPGDENKWVNVTVDPIIDNGNIVGGLHIVRDISECKKAEEKIKKQNILLKKLDYIKTEFLNITTHELRTPMAAIKGYSQMLYKQKLGRINKEQKDAIDVILRNSNRLDNLIQEILDISRLESGTMKFIPEKTNVKKLLEETIETMKSAADLKNIQIKLIAEDNLPKINIDKERIKQVVGNLVDNAIKFSPEGSIINVRASKNKDDVIFEVQDFGRGIPKNKQKKIFERFYQIDSGIDRKFGGVGLGLAISQGIVKYHYGKLWVDSSEIGKGSTFRFNIPINSKNNLQQKIEYYDLFEYENVK